MDPLYGCAKGKDIQDMSRVALWCKLAPYVTRVAKLSPLFAVSYLETVGRDPSAHVCIVKGKPKLMTCTACRKVRYCQKKKMPENGLVSTQDVL